MYKLKQGNCLEVMQEIPTGSVDMILCDLPYGTTECKWDTVIPLEPLWEQYKRVIEKNGAIVLFCAFPFTASLMLSNMSLFRYSLVWKRSRVSRFAQSRYRPLNEHEDILVFSFGKCSDNSTIKMKYFPQGVVDIPEKTSVYKAHALRPGRKDKIRSTTKTNFPRSILDFPNDSNTTHPTQKPVALCEYLIKTYTNEGEWVLDNTMGSGTTGVACINTNRNFIGIEQDEKYFSIAKQRIEKAQIDKTATLE